MKIKLFVVITIFLFGVGNAFAQKAEPNRITFAKGKSSEIKTGTLKSGQNYKYVFGAKAG